MRKRGLDTPVFAVSYTCVVDLDSPLQSAFWGKGKDGHAVGRYSRTAWPLQQQLTG